MDPFDDEDLPPPYSPGSPLSCPTHHPDASQTFEHIEMHITTAKHCHEIRRFGHDRFAIERKGLTSNDTFSFLEGQTITDDTTAHTALYARCNKIGSARISTGHSDFDICLASSHDSSPSDHIRVEHIRGGLLHSSSYRLKVGSRKLAWRQCHGPHLFGGSGDWVLEDLHAVGSLAPSHHRANGTGPKIIVGGQIMAVFRAMPCAWIHGRSAGYTVGQIKWSDEHGDTVELTALLALVVILQQN